MILVDSSVLIDVIEQKPVWAEWSVERLNECAAQQALVINIVIYAEISRSFADPKAEDRFLRSANIKLDPISSAAAFAAARAHVAYRAAGGARLATLPDFFIGAHAQEAGHTLVTRDPVRIKTYFPKVRLICPED
jgi:predicted nucleic acid-binding protein